MDRKEWDRGGNMERKVREGETKLKKERRKGGSKLEEKERKEEGKERMEPPPTHTLAHTHVRTDT